MPTQHSTAGRQAGIVRLLLLALATWFVLASTASGAVGVRDFCCLVPMSDGLRLATNVYLPRFPKARCPVILIRTPYPLDQFGRLEARFACREGFGLVVQEIRGSSRVHLRAIIAGPEPGSDERSSGRTQYATPLFEHDGWTGSRDGQATVRWIARQAWCNGQVFTWGPSAMGITQNLLAPGAPAALKAQMIAMAPSDMFAQAVFQGGALRKEAVEGWLAEMPFAKNNMEAILAHPTYDSFWTRRNCLPQAEQVNAPGLFIGGWHDAFLQGTLDSFTTIQNQGGPAARGKCRLVVGPWTHKDLVWVIDPRKADRLPAAASAVRFFREQLVSCGSASRSMPVCYYLMGDRCDPRSPGGRWCASENWPPPSTATRFYFHADRSLTRSAPVEPGDLAFQYDPCNPVPTRGGRNLTRQAGPLDQRSVESRGDVLVFSTDVLHRPLVVAGRIEARLHVSSDCPDTDFTVKLTDVYPDGRSILVCDGILRARFRESFEKPSLLEPGKVYPLAVDLWSTAIAFSPGHRIRVAISSSNAPRFEPNPNTGAPLLPPAPPRMANNTVHLSPAHASSIVLPVCSGVE